MVGGRVSKSSEHERGRKDGECTLGSILVSGDCGLGCASGRSELNSSISCWVTCSGSSMLSKYFAMTFPCIAYPPTIKSSTLCASLRHPIDRKISMACGVFASLKSDGSVSEKSCDLLEAFTLRYITSTSFGCWTYTVACPKKLLSCPPLSAVSLDLGFDFRLIHQQQDARQGMSSILTQLY